MDGGTTRPLKVGLMLPDTEREMGGASARWSDLLSMARRAEAVGFDSIWVSDHLLFRFEGKEPQGVWECWSLLAALAASTTRVELGPLVSCTAFRNPALLAKIVDTVDEISGGRLILGLGAGWHAPEYGAFGYPFDHRVSRFEEALTIVRSLLREGRVDFDGTYYPARECELRPRGPRPNGPPIMIGSTGERMLRLVAQHADLWNAWGRNSPEAIPQLRDRVDAACVETGRDPATLGRTVSVLADLPGKAGRPREREAALAGTPEEREAALAGTPEELAEALREYAREGIGHVQLVLDPNTLPGIEALGPVLELLDHR